MVSLWVQKPSTNLGATPRSALQFAAQLLDRFHTNMDGGNAVVPPTLCGTYHELPNHTQIREQA